ncbi:MAG: Zn-ribbon domain-containing OB-fold protein [Candidatus Hodarchaeales archaeon]
MVDTRTWSDQSGKLETYNEIRFSGTRFGRHRLQGVKCKKCGALYFPERFVCPQCHSRELEPYLCARTGVIDTFWVDFRFAPVGYGDIEHRIIAMVRLDDGLTIITEIVDIPQDMVKNGMKVEMVVRKLRRSDLGNVLYGYKFRPVDFDYSTIKPEKISEYSSKGMTGGHPAGIPKTKGGHPAGVPMGKGGHPAGIPKGKGGHPRNIPKE